MRAQLVHKKRTLFNFEKKERVALESNFNDCSRFGPRKLATKKIPVAFAAWFQ